MKMKLKMMNRKTKYNLEIIPQKRSSDFMGIKIRGEKIQIYIPQTLKLSENEIQRNREIVLFLQSLNLTKLTEEDILNGNAIGPKWPFQSYIWVIHDYIENGIFYNHEKMYSRDKSGKIDWKRTLRTTPIISDGNVIYDKLITSKMTASNDKISEIYKVCVNQSIERMGWVFNLNFHLHSDIYMNREEMAYLVKQEYLSTFDDIKRLRFKHMLNIIEGIDDSQHKSNEHTFGITNYYYVFEYMVDVLFHGISGNLKKKYDPSGYWLLNGLEKLPSSNLRPDTICLNQQTGETFILDSKMYQYGFTKSVRDLPQTSSMQKQITYGDFVHNYVDHSAKIRNAFILPFRKDKFLNDKNVQFSNDNNLAYIGKAMVNYRNKEQKQDWDNIYTFMIDFNYLLNNYMRKDKRYILSLEEKIRELLKTEI